MDNFVVEVPIETAALKVLQEEVEVVDSLELDSEDDVVVVPLDFLEDSRVMEIAVEAPLDSVLVEAALAKIEARGSPYYCNLIPAYCLT